MPRRPSSPRTTLVQLPAAQTALLLIDVINDLAFDGAGPLIARSEAMAPRLAGLKRQAVRAGVPVVYVNDNFGKWRSDFQRTVAHCTRPTSPGRAVSSRLRPTARDYFVLKPKHSGFYDTTLDTLLRELRIRRVVMAGLAGNICVLFTANDAYMRGLKIYVPADCVASNTDEDNEHALRQVAVVMKGDTTPAERLRFRKATARSRRRAVA